MLLVLVLNISFAPSVRSSVRRNASTVPFKVLSPMVRFFRTDFGTAIHGLEVVISFFPLLHYNPHFEKIPL